MTGGVWRVKIEHGICARAILVDVRHSLGGDLKHADGGNDGGIVDACERRLVDEGEVGQFAPQLCR